MSLDIAIVGAGFAGSAAALFLADQGHRVTVYEKVADPSPVGAGIVVQPSGLLVLKALGLDQEVYRKAAHLKRLYCVTPKGVPIANLAYGELYPDRVGLGTHRGLLFSVLHRALESSAAECVFGFDAIALEPLTHGWRLRFENEEARDHELVVIANGANSHFRRSFPMLLRDKPYPWGALWFVGEDREQVYRDELFQVASGTRGLYGALPTGSLLNDPTPLASLFWSVPADAVDEVRGRGLADFRERVLGVDPRAEFLLDQIEDVDQLLFSDYRDVVMHPYHDRNIVFIGDAAHAASPQLGQGTNLGLMDALVLARCLSAKVSIEAALAKYSHLRHPHLSYYQFASRWLTPLFQSHHSWLGPVRDRFMSWGTKMAYPRREMLRTMAGGKTGVFSRPMRELDERSP